MTFRYIHIGINFGDEPTPLLMDRELSRICEDWMRYAPNNWVVWTSKTLPRLNHEIKSVLSLHDQLALFEVSPNFRDGFHYQYVWQWLDVKRDPETGMRILPSALADSHGRPTDSTISPPLSIGRLPPKKP